MTEEAPPADGTGPGNDPSPWDRGDRSRAPAVVGAVLLLALVGAGGAFLLTWRGDLARDAVATAAVAEPTAVTVDAASDADLEAAVRADPRDWALRLRLAHRYFDAGDYEEALQHYLVVLQAGGDEPPSDVERAEALSHAGWVAFESGEFATAHRLAGESLALRPEDPEALWFVANIRAYGLGDRQGAVAPLEELAARDELAPRFREEVERLLALVRGDASS